MLEHTQCQVILLRTSSSSAPWQIHLVSLTQSLTMKPRWSSNICSCFAFPTAEIVGKCYHAQHDFISVPVISFLASDQHSQRFNRLTIWQLLFCGPSWLGPDLILNRSRAYMTLGDQGPSWYLSFINCSLIANVHVTTTNTNNHMKTLNVKKPFAPKL